MTGEELTDIAGGIGMNPSPPDPTIVPDCPIPPAPAPPAPPPPPGGIIIIIIGVVIVVEGPPPPFPKEE